MLYHLAFNNSAQANLVCDITNGNIVLANKASCKLLGYSKNEILALPFNSLIEQRKGTLKTFFQQKHNSPQSGNLQNVVLKSRKIIKCEMTAAIFLDKDGIEKATITLTDMSKSILKQITIDKKKGEIVAENIVIAKSRQEKIDTHKEKIVKNNINVALAKSEAKLAENNEWIKQIAQASYDVMWDWDIASGNIYVGDSIEEVFGYKVKNNTVDFNQFRNCLLREEKKLVEAKLFTTLDSSDRSWQDAFRFSRYDGTIAHTNCRASIVRNEKGKAIRLIGAIHDVSELQVLENRLERKIHPAGDDSEKFLLSAKLSMDVIWDWKIQSNEIFIGEGYKELFGYAIQNNEGNTADWAKCLHPKGKAQVRSSLQQAIASSAIHWQHAYEFIRFDGSLAKIFDKATIFRDKEGKAYRMIGVMHDVTRQSLNKMSTEDLPANKKSILVDKIKHVITDLVHYSNEQLQTNFSDYLSQQLGYDYTYLANLFSEVEKISIQAFIINQKIERAKDLIKNGELTLTAIASKLHYSSIAHLSNQFKKVTGINPTNFKELQHRQHPVAEDV
ncbi:MAG: PAS domain-containing protein [Ginsengibacter sp.]